jgi:hypothetical protein
MDGEARGRRGPIARSVDGLQRVRALDDVALREIYSHPPDRVERSLDRKSVV